MNSRLLTNEIVSVAPLFKYLSRASNDLFKISRGRLRHDHLRLKENNLVPDDKIRYIWGLVGPIFIL